MKNTIKYFNGSLYFTVGAVLFSVILGYFIGGMGLAISYTIAVLTLGVLETALSFDNAVLNAAYLKDMNEESKHWFLTWGMIIAVFGMRLVLPIIIVSISAQVGPIEAVKMALFDKETYQLTMESTHVYVMGFGASFLLLVALEFFLDIEKDSHWIPLIEKPFVSLSKIPYVIFIFSVLIVSIIAINSDETEKLLYSSFAGITLFYFINWIKNTLENKGDTRIAGTVDKIQGLMMGTLVFLEILDASMSFDGVIAAFAITNDFLIIGAGLGIGAMFVRSLTIYLVDQGTMEELAYLEHGAFYAIMFLVIVMFASALHIEIPEAITAGVSAGLILIAGVHSHLINKKAME